MNIGMDEFLHLHAGCTGSATVILQPVFAIEILHKGKGQCQAAVPRMPCKQKGMADPVVPDGLDEPFLYGLLANNLAEEHGAKIFKFM